jgi:hypothetical protein
LALPLAWLIADSLIVTSCCGLCQGAGIIPGVDEVILRTIVMPKLLPLLDKITAAIRAAQSERQLR